MTGHRLYFALLTIATTVVSAEVAVPHAKRLLMSRNELAIARHEHDPEDRVADPSYPRSEFSALMQSPCRPEADGYFGSTSGDPVVMRYLFEMETRSFEKLDVTLDAINEHVMDSVVAGTFPSICDPMRADTIRTLNDGTVVSGFHFSPEALTMSSRCEPILHDAYRCAVFHGEVGIFGHNLTKEAIDDVTRRILTAINGGVHLVSKVGVVRLHTTADMLSQVSGPVVIGITQENFTPTRSTRMTAGAKFGVSLVCLVLLAAFTFLGVAAWQNHNNKKDRKTEEAEEPTTQRRRRVFQGARWYSPEQLEEKYNDEIDNWNVKLEGRRLYLDDEGNDSLSLLESPAVSVQDGFTSSSHSSGSRSCKYTDAFVSEYEDDPFDQVLKDVLSSAANLDELSHISPGTLT